MSEAERAEDSVIGVSMDGDVEGDHKLQRSGPSRLANLPLEALLYYVMYGDDSLKRLS